MFLAIRSKDLEFNAVPATAAPQTAVQASMSPTPPKQMPYRTRGDLIGCVASIIDALALLTLLLLPMTPPTGLRVYIMLLIDPVARLIGYWRRDLVSHER
jgi:hypothetical protein